MYAVSYDSMVYTAQKVNEVVTAQDANHAVRMELKPVIMRLSSVKGTGAGSFEKCTQQTLFIRVGALLVCVYGSCGF